MNIEGFENAYNIQNVERYYRTFFVNEAGELINPNPPIAA